MKLDVESLRKLAEHEIRNAERERPRIKKKRLAFWRRACEARIRQLERKLEKIEQGKEPSDLPYYRGRTAPGYGSINARENRAKVLLRYLDHVSTPTVSSGDVRVKDFLNRLPN